MKQSRQEVNADDLESFVAYIALCYHEARNVRELIERGYVHREPFEKVVRSLARNREMAWGQIQPQRQAAIAVGDPEKAVGIFSERFGLTLSELHELYLNEHWKHARLYGGNAWAQITAVVMQTYRSLCAGDDDDAQECLRHLETMNHNNDRLVRKLRELDAYLEESKS